MLRCAVCQTTSHESLCEGCQSLLKPPENPCQICAKPLNQAGGVCGECRSEPPAFSHTHCAAIYQAPVDKWVQQLKFGERLDRARIMGETLAQLLTDVNNSIPIIPVPLHPKRLRKRGYNQAFEIAKIICKQQNRPLLSDVLVRIKNTEMQAELHEKQRAANVRAAFQVVKPIEHPKVLLLDDVMTTGQTLRSASNCLIKAGVVEVKIAVFARSGN
jgi:ComF family protein